MPGPGTNGWGQDRCSFARGWGSTTPPAVAWDALICQNPSWGPAGLFSGRPMAARGLDIKSANGNSRKCSSECCTASAYLCRLRDLHLDFHNSQHFSTEKKIQEMTQTKSKAGVTVHVLLSPVVGGWESRAMWSSWFVRPTAWAGLMPITLSAGTTCHRERHVTQSQKATSQIPAI